MDKRKYIERKIGKIHYVSVLVCYLFVGCLLSGVDVSSQLTDVESHLSDEAPAQTVNMIIRHSTRLNS